MTVRLGVVNSEKIMATNKTSDQFSQSPITGEGKVKELKDVLTGKSEPRIKAQKIETKPIDEEIPPELDRQGSDLEQELQAAITKAGEEKERALRIMADFENFRKRMQREKEDMIKFGNEKILGELIPVHDHLEMTLSHAQEQGKEKDAFLDGVGLVARQLLTVMEKFGVVIVEGEGKAYDPHTQECIGSQPSETITADHVIKVHRKGFLLHGRLIRPAMVTIAKNPAESSDDSAEEIVH